MAKFKIETLKWSWPKTVKNPSVYRDEEFVKCNSKEEALESIGFLMGQAKGLTYTITVKRDDKYFTYFRHSMPCLGGLVKYLDSHGERYYMNPYFPRDIRVAFPEGDIIYIACHRTNILSDIKSPYGEFILSEESPWVSAFGNKDTIVFKKDYFVLTNMDTDPTVFYSIMRLGGLASAYGFNSQIPKWNPKAQVLAMKSSAADPRRLAGQKPIKISGGTWAEGFGYTRPFNESIFKTKLPKALKDFRKVGSYPNAPYTTKFYAETMETMFKVKVNEGLKPALEKPLVEAWDYFKEESKNLKDVA